jgi:RNA polymerase sigma factor (sigma-70 family)
MQIHGDELGKLVGRVASGDRTAFTPLFEQLWPIVRRFCAKMMHGDIDADDAAQEAMMKCFNQAASYDSQRPVLPWVLTISAWECRTMMQKRRRRREMVTENMPPSTSTATNDDIMRRDLGDAVDAALSHLVPTDRAAVVAAFWQSDIDENLPTTAVDRKRKQRALQRLRLIWRKLYGNT